jgi:hypothetical protein
MKIKQGLLASMTCTSAVILVRIEQHDRDIKGH